MKESVTGCTHCGVCTENCEFLKKYDLTIGDTEKLSKMAYLCFLCGKCSKVCPARIAKLIPGKAKATLPTAVTTRYMKMAAGRFSTVICCNAWVRSPFNSRPDQPEWFRRRNQRTGIHFKRTGRTDPG